MLVTPLLFFFGCRFFIIWLPPPEFADTPDANFSFAMLAAATVHAHFFIFDFHFRR